MAEITKKNILAEVVAVCAAQNKPVPEGADRANLQGLFDLLDQLTGTTDPRRPAPVVAGAQRAATPSVTPPAASDAEQPPAATPAPEAPPPPAPPKAPPPPAPPKAPEVEAKLEEEPEARGKRASASGRYVVAPGRVVDCLAGPLGAFQEVRAIDVGGEAELDALWAQGAIAAAKR